MTAYIHVNRGRIDSNRKRGLSDPVLKAQKGKYGKAMYGNDITIVKDGEVVARFRYNPTEPILPCGARVVVETENEVWIGEEKL